MAKTVLVEQVILLLFMLATGFYGYKRHIIDSRSVKAMTDLLINITMPLMIIASFNFPFSVDLLKNFSIVLIATITIHLLSYFIGKILFCHCEENQRKVLIFSIIFSNCGFMGIPVISSLLGKIGALYSSIYLIGFNAFVWTLGVTIYNSNAKEKGLKNVLTNPGIVGILIGFSLFVCPVKLPEIIYSAVDSIGSMTTPLSMLIIGAGLATCELREIFKGFHIYWASIIRLLILPLLTLLVCKLLPIDHTVVGVCVLSTAMPIANMTMILAEKYGGDTKLASRLVFFSTAFSMITIPLLFTIL